MKTSNSMAQGITSHPLWKILIVGIFLSCFSTSVSLAETATPSQIQPSALATLSPEAIRIERFRRAARARLLHKLTKKDGRSAAIYIMPPVDFTNLQSPDPVVKTIRKAIVAYDKRLRVNEGNYPMESLTLEQFRKAIIHLRADIILVQVMHPTNFDLYLYDKRTPFQIYAHTENIASAAQYHLTDAAAAYYTKLLVRRTLYRYIKNQYYELPRDNSPTILRSEIPRFIASMDSVAVMNREAASRFYASFNVGAALSRNTNGGLWNSNLLSAQLGFRPSENGHLYLEGSFEMFAYNMTIGSLKYIFPNKSHDFKIAAGLGFGFGNDREVLNWDQTGGIGAKKYVVPSLSFLLPISDVYLKAETQFMIGIDHPKFIFTVMPGLFVMF